jgi:hypothetical protein
VRHAGGTVTGRTFTIGDRLVDNLGLAENLMAVGGYAGRENTGCGRHECARNQKKNYRVPFVYQELIPLNGHNLHKVKQKLELLDMQNLHRREAR